LAEEIGLPPDLAQQQAQSLAAGLTTQMIEPPAGLSADLNADDSAIIDLTQREQKITTRRLMEMADISRATATRRLTALVERGLLNAHGQGRGAYYALPAPTSSNESTPAWTTLHDNLHGEQDTLVTQYAMTGIGLLNATTSQPAKFVVCFDEPPDLATFFRLRQHLASLSHLDVDLLPDFTLSPAQLQHEVEWIWRV